MASSSTLPTQRPPLPSSSPHCAAPERCDGPPQDLRKDSIMSVSAWIVVGEQPAIGNLITVARSLGGQVGAVVAGSRSVAETVAASGVDKVVWCGAAGEAPIE